MTDTIKIKTHNVANLQHIPSFNENGKTFTGRVDVYVGNKFLYTQVVYKTERKFRCEALADAQEFIDSI